MKLLVLGSRAWPRSKKQKVLQSLEWYLLKYGKELTIITGMSEGIDTWADAWAVEHDLATERYPPLHHKKLYLMARNAEMVGSCDKVLAFINGTVGGTQFTVDYAKKRNKPIEIIIP